MENAIRSKKIWTLVRKGIVALLPRPANKLKNKQIWDKLLLRPSIEMKAFSFKNESTTINVELKNTTIDKPMKYPKWPKYSFLSRVFVVKISVSFFLFYQELSKRLHCYFSSKQLQTKSNRKQFQRPRYKFASKRCKKRV